MRYSKKEKEVLFKSFKFQKDLDSLYSKIAKISHEAKNIQLRFYPQEELLSLYPMNPFKHKNKTKFLWDPILLAGEDFLDMSEDMQIAGVLHELGHFKRFERYSIKVLEKRLKWLVNGNNYIHSFPKVIDKFSKKKKHINKKYEKILLLHEINADNYVVKLGYGEALLELLEEQNPSISTKGIKNQFKERIKNLEEKLGK